jgi:hypothetical protein
MPKMLLVAKGQAASVLALEAKRANIEVVPVPESDLEVFISEAREAFRDQFGRSQ